MPKLLAVDTETTGLDTYHHCKPFFVSTCDDEGNVTYFEWDVDPLTREVEIPHEDCLEIRALIDSAERIVGHNFKFDATALINGGVIESFDYSKLEDTIIAAHLLASLKPRNLTDVVMQYLGYDLEPFEKEVKKQTVKARGIVRRKHPHWRRATKGDPDLPSNTESSWKADMWLPKALAEYETEQGVFEFKKDDHPFRHCLKDYAVKDAEATAALWPVMEREIRKRGLWAIYREAMRLPEVTHRMEARGITRHGPRSEHMTKVRLHKSKHYEETCLNVARSYGFDLKLPKKGRSDSLTDFCFGEEGLNLPVLGRTEKGFPSLKKDVLEQTLLQLQPGKKPHLFVSSMLKKAKVDQDLVYLKAYERFAMPLYVDGCEGEGYEVADWSVLHPNINLTGTDTLRTSSSNPNSQNIKVSEDAEESLRYCFGPAPGREWWSLDYKNLELRLPFYLSGERELIELFEHPDDPPYYGSHHMITFHLLFPELWDRAVKEAGLEKAAEYCKTKLKPVYKRVKNGNFAKQYGGQRAKVDATFGRAGAFDLLESKFTRLAALNKEAIDFANRWGYVETLPDRTIDPARGYPLLCSRMDNGKILPTVPLNYKIQGTASRLVRTAMWKVEKQLEKWREVGFDGWMIMLVHDELVFDFPKRGDPTLYDAKKPNDLKNKTIYHCTNLWRVKTIQRIMERGGRDLVPSIPTPTSCEYHAESWAEGVSL